eukprot:GEMP01008630.1.p1 GENE.GEMP01008630.1~~GEMP01008630.1.p1  ORF type:complete len:509 (+),score=102.45 GEMP01008630.1:189-1715(+)
MAACCCTRQHHPDDNGTKAVKTQKSHLTTNPNVSGTPASAAVICEEENCDAELSLIRGCIVGRCHLHCKDRTCPVHLPVHLLRRNTDQELPPLKMVNGIWVIDSSKNVHGKAFSADMRGIINPFETSEDLEHFRNAKKKLAHICAECSICFEPMSLEPICVLMNDFGFQAKDTRERRACCHVHHVRCIDGLAHNAPKGCMQNCPLCRAEFTRFQTLPTDYSLNKAEYWKFVADSRDQLPWTEVAELIPCILPVDPCDLEKNEERLKKIYCTRNSAGTEAVTEERFALLITRFVEGSEKGLEPFKSARTFRTTAYLDIPCENPSAPLGGIPTRFPSLSIPSFKGRIRLVRDVAEIVCVRASTSEANWFGIWNGDVGENGRMTCCELVRACIKTLDPEYVQNGVGGIEMAVRAMWNDLDPDKKGYITSEDFYGERGRVLHDTFRCTIMPDDDLLKRRDTSDPVGIEPPLSAIQLTAVPGVVYQRLDGGNQGPMDETMEVILDQVGSTSVA